MMGTPLFMGEELSIKGMDCSVLLKHHFLPQMTDYFPVMLRSRLMKGID